MQFDDFAHSYSENAFIQKDLIDWAIPFLDIIPFKNQSIIELGAGTGLLTKHLLEKNRGPILATDSSARMIIEGRRQVPKVDWQFMDAWNASPNFGHIFSSSLLQWAPDPRLVIANWAKNLSIGGTIHALFFIDQTLWELRQLISLENRIQWQTRSQWEQIFKNAGLEVHLCRDLVKCYKFRSGLDLLKNLKQTGTCLKNSICGSYLKKIIRDYDKEFSFQEGVYSTWHFCQIVGIKH